MVERSGNGVPTLTSYSLPNDSRLLTYVGDLERTAPAGFIKDGVLQDLAQKIDIRPALDNLPPGITEDDFEGINWLSALTECATAQYAKVFEFAGEKYNAEWLGRFTQNIWAPDEMGHHAPFKIILMQMGVPQSVVENEVKRVQSLDYIHESGSTPAHLTTFGMLQELLTREWYTETRRILKASPEAARMVHLVEVREALHTDWYRNMTAFQIEENPALINHVAEGLRRFQMPGNLLVPDLEAKANHWLHTMHQGDLSGVKRDIIRLTHRAVGSDTKNLGKLLIAMGVQDESLLQRVTMQQVKRALDMVGGELGYGLLGEGVLQSVGLEGLYQEPGKDNIPGRIRSVFRNYVARRVNNTLDNEFGFSGIS